jgi:DNA-binding transcriptional MocR family regulator
MVPLTMAKEFLDLHTPALTQRLTAAFIGGAHLESHLAVLRTEFRARRDGLVTALRQHCPRLSYRIPSGGYYVWAELPAPLTAAELLPIAAEHGVTVRPGPQFTPGGGGQDHIRLCFSALPPRTIAEGARRLGEALQAAWQRLAANGRAAPAAASSVV